MFRKIATITLAGAALLTVASQVDAARGGNGNGSAGTIVSATTFDLNEPAPLVHGQAITFTVSTTETDRPFSRVECFRGGDLVYSSSMGHFDDYYAWFGEPIHHLNSLAWPAGEGDCTASLVYMANNGRWRTVTAFSFHVEP